MQEIGRLIIFDDITDRSELERRLVQADKLSSIGLLAAGVAHEVNTPLAVISTYAQMLAKQVSGRRQKSKLLEKIAKQTFRASEIVNSLLNFSRTSPAEFGEVDVNRVIEETISLVRHQLEKATVHTAAGSRVRAVVVNGNAGKLQQVFLNLVLNARDAMDGGGTLTVRTWSDGDAPGSRSRTPGRVSRTSICRASTIRSSRPRRPGRAPASAFSHLRHRSGARRSHRSAKRAWRWYTVPSGVPSVQKASECLIPHPARKAEFSSSTTRPISAKAWKRFSTWKAMPSNSRRWRQRVCAKLKKASYDLVLLDLMMPDRSGMDVLPISARRDQETPIFMITAYGSVEVAVKALKAGANDYFSKPWDNEKLMIEIETMIAKRRLESENTQLKRALKQRYSFPNIVGKSERMLRVLDLVSQVAPSRATILITGETGTGKELIAKAIHANSPRAEQLSWRSTAARCRRICWNPRCSDT